MLLRFRHLYRTFASKRSRRFVLSTWLFVFRLRPDGCRWNARVFSYFSRFDQVGEGEAGGVVLRVGPNGVVEGQHLGARRAFGRVRLPRCHVTSTL